MTANKQRQAERRRRQRERMERRRRGLKKYAEAQLWGNLLSAAELEQQAGPEDAPCNYPPPPEKPEGLACIFRAGHSVPCRFFTTPEHGGFLADEDEGDEDECPEE